MTEHSSMVHVSINDDTTALATAAVRLGLCCGVTDQGLPLEMKVPNAETRAAMEESRALLVARRARMASAEALEKNGHQ